MPFRIGIGGFLRSYYVLPRLTKILVDNDYEVKLYIPANALRTYMLYHLPLEAKHDSNMHFNPRNLVDKISESILDEISELEKKSRYTFVIEEKFIERNIEYNKGFLLRELSQKSVNKLYDAIFSKLRPLLIHAYERRFAEEVRHFFKDHIYGYSMHETPDAVIALATLSSKHVKTTVLLQLDLGKKFLEKTVNIRAFKELNRRTRLAGILSVSPAPVIETPEIFSLTKKVRILIPGVALREDIPREAMAKEPNSVIYYGRLSVEKGVLDLLKSWSVVEKSTDAKLYIAGRFDAYKTRTMFKKVIEKHRLKRVTYLGYLDRERLVKTVSRSSLLAYPSYRDSFSMVVLESLAMGLRIIAYDIPAIRYIYQGSRNVELVPTGNFQLLAQKIIENLKKNFERDDTTTKILSLYSSWEKVALEEYNHLNEMILGHR